jgi:hypothetical protein
MPEVRPCPYCGGPIEVESTTRVDEQTEPGAVELTRDVSPEERFDLPPVPLLGAGSHDDDYFNSSSSSRLMPALPDPILGPFVTPSSSTASTLLAAPMGEGPSEAFPAIDLGSPLMAGPTREPSKPEASEAEEIEEYEPEGRRTSWASVLLASYASAITLGLAWTLIKGGPKERPGRETPPSSVVASPEPARQAGLSRKVAPPEPILGEHFAAIGKPLRVGDLEVTPIGVRRQAVTLERSTSFAKPDRKDGGKGALVLRLKLKNTSNDAVFAPLDPTYLRERGKEIVDTFLETANDERIYPYPLAIDSEWSIVGQDFRELRPGESREVAIVSMPEAPADSEGPFTWRVRLRTGINRTDTIGLRWPER